MARIIALRLEAAIFISLMNIIYMPPAHSLLFLARHGTRTYNAPKYSDHNLIGLNPYTA